MRSAGGATAAMAERIGDDTAGVALGKIADVAARGKGVDGIVHWSGANCDNQTAWITSR